MNMAKSLLFLFLIFIPFAQAQDNNMVDNAAVPMSASEESVEEDLDVGDPFVDSLPKKRLDVEVPIEEEILPALEAQQPEPDFGALKISGLVWGQVDPKAIIDGVVYGIGDEVIGAKILKISKEGILFGYNDKKYLLKRNMAVPGKGGEK